MKQFTEEEIKYYQEMAETSGRTNGWKETVDKDILMIPGVAWWLAFSSKETGWSTNDLDVLLLYRDINVVIYVYEILFDYGKISKEQYNVCSIITQQNFGPIKGEQVNE